MESKEIIFKHVKKVYGKTEVVKDLNLTIHDGERLILLGRPAAANRPHSA